MFQVCHHISTEMKTTFVQFGLKQPNFDVMVTLLRAGPTQALIPDELLEQMSIASGAMTSVFIT